jgi:predicted GIY-YIG superfamily endonuclease
MSSFHYVYILCSENYPDRHYTGFTEDLKSRLDVHNPRKLRFHPSVLSMENPCSVCLFLRIDCPGI